MSSLWLQLIRARYRFFRRILTHVRKAITYFVFIRYRLVRRIRFRYLRLLVFVMWRLWLREVHGFDKIPINEAALIVSNHSSYFDFFVLASVLKKQTVFVALKSLNVRPFVGWFMKLDIIIYVDRDKPGYKFFKELMWHLTEQKRLAVIYPEGTRSRTGKMLAPKLGFVKLAMKTGVPIIPVAMRGTYEIMPPQKHLPRFRKCDIHVGDRIYISPQNEEFRDIFYRKKHRRYEDLDDEDLQEIAYRIMDKIRIMAGQEWDESAGQSFLAPLSKAKLG